MGVKLRESGTKCSRKHLALLLAGFVMHSISMRRTTAIQDAMGYAMTNATCVRGMLQPRRWLWCENGCDVWCCCVVLWSWVVVVVAMMFKMLRGAPSAPDKKRGQEIGGT